MIVVDASVIFEFLLFGGRNPELTDILAEQELAAPALIEYEIGHALRRISIAGKISDERAREALNSFMLLSIELHFAEALMPRSWELRRNFTFYDASYVVLAESLNAPLYTRDKRLASAPGHNAKIICF